MPNSSVRVLPLLTCPPIPPSTKSVDELWVHKGSNYSMSTTINLDPPTLPLMMIRNNQQRRRGAPPTRKGSTATYYSSDINSFDGFDDVILENCIIHFHERNNPSTASIHEGANIVHTRASTTSYILPTWMLHRQCKPATTSY